MIFSTMSRVESSSPPGVLISRITASLCCWSACASPRAMNSSLMGWIIWLTDRCSTEALAGMARSRASSARFMRISLTPVRAGGDGGHELVELQRLAQARVRPEALDRVADDDHARRIELAGDRRSDLGRDDHGVVAVA